MEPRRALERRQTLRTVLEFLVLEVSEHKNRAKELQKSVGKLSPNNVSPHADVDIRKVQELLRHRHTTSTQIYDKRRRSTSESASHDVPI